MPEVFRHVGPRRILLTSIKEKSAARIGNTYNRSSQEEA
jgi:hypothetical protein